MDNEVNERFKNIEDRVNRQDSRIDKVVDQQGKDHEKLIIIEQNTINTNKTVNSIQDKLDKFIETSNKKWTDWDKENLKNNAQNRKDLIKFIAGIVSGIMLAVILHYLGLK